MATVVTHKLKLVWHILTAVQFLHAFSHFDGEHTGAMHRDDSNSDDGNECHVFKFKLIMTTRYVI